MKNLKVYLLATTLFTTILTTSCKRVDETPVYNFKTSNKTSTDSLDNDIKKNEKFTTSFIEKNKNIINAAIDKIDTSKNSIDDEIKKLEISEKSVTISFTGDCTLGTYAKSGNRAFEVVFESQKDYDYYFKNVKHIFEKDDYTVVNLEGPLTDATTYDANKPFAFKGREDYVNILLSGNVEAANLSNNHIRDYFDEGYNDTKNILTENNIAYFDNKNFYIEEIEGLKFGFAGFKAFNLGTKSEIDEALKYFNDNNVDIKIIELHGGIEYDYQFDSIKQQLAYYSIDNGADLIVGHHPHILQGIEEYNDKYIIYSLGNFCYGGNRNPIDKNSAIAQVTFNFKDDKFIDSNLKLIPVSISSVVDCNNFQPTVLENEEKEYVLKLINDYSKNFKYNE